MQYPTVKDVESIIELMKSSHGVDSTIINRGQLEFVLEKPRMKVFGHEQYPELYQKAAILMEGLTKAHVLNDGNKRCAMMMADLMVRINDAQMILPLKTIRLSVDTAMDSDDEMSSQIQQWFRIHIVRNTHHIGMLLKELVEERSILENLCMANKIEDAGSLLDKWMAFESYPEPKKMWNQLIKKWDSSDLPTQRSMIRGFLRSVTSEMYCHDPNHLLPSNKTIMEISDLTIVGHDEEDLAKYEARILEHENLMKQTENVDVLLGNAHLLEMHRKMNGALEYHSRVLEIEPTNGHAYYHMGMIHGYLKEYEKSLDCFKKCKNLNSKEPHIRHYIALGLGFLGRKDEALTEINELLVAKPDEPLHLGLKGAIQASMGDFEGAAKSARLALDSTQADPEHVELIKSALLLLDGCRAAIGGDANAINATKGILDESIPAYKNLRPEGCHEAIRQYGMVLKKDPNHLHALILIGKAHYNINEYEKALAYLRKALEISPQDKICLELIRAMHGREEECN